MTIISILGRFRRKQRRSGVSNEQRKSCFVERTTAKRVGGAFSFFSLSLNFSLDVFCPSSAFSGFASTVHYCKIFAYNGSEMRSSWFFFRYIIEEWKMVLDKPKDLLKKISRVWRSRFFSGHAFLEVSIKLQLKRLISDWWDLIWWLTKTTQT